MVYFFLSKLSHKRREKVLDISGTMDNNMTMSIYGLISFNYPLMRDSILIEP